MYANIDAFFIWLLYLESYQLETLDLAMVPLSGSWRYCSQAERPQTSCVAHALHYCLPLPCWINLQECPRVPTKLSNQKRLSSIIATTVCPLSESFPCYHQPKQRREICQHTPTPKIFHKFTEQSKRIATLLLIDRIQRQW